MRRAWLVAVGLLGGCGQAPEPASTAGPDAAPPALTVTAGDLRVLAYGTREGDGLLRVQRLELRRGDSAAPLQVIADLATETPSTPEAPGLETPDMNFDGHPDLRLIEFRSAGPNTPWLNWLYDPAQARWVASPALDALPSAEFDADARELRSPWRDGAARHGVDVHGWQDGELRPLRRELREAGPDGRETLSHQVWADGGWRPAEAR
jgi:hypothetical protein